MSQNFIIPLVPLNNAIPSFANLFEASVLEGNTKIPKGWLSLFILACREAHMQCAQAFKISHITIDKGGIYVQFSIGHAQVQKDFQKTLAEVRAYCPYCGVLQEDFKPCTGIESASANTRT